VIVAVPTAASAATEEEFFHAYTWVINWSLGFAAGNWDCVVVLPSVAEPSQNARDRAAEERALEVIHGQDVPWLQRSPGDTAPATELLVEKLRVLTVP